MARSDAVWGIDLGNCSLKALRCRPADEEGQVVADAFDYIEYPKILTQPGAEPSELMADALREFLSRNNLKGDRVAISVAGQAGLARFVKLPPVESKKIPDIVKFEAKQQIPFDLDDVIWDYQRMGGGLEESGFLLETEIGLFAMKRDQVFRALEPLTHAGIDVDVVQLAPLAIYNFMCFDQLTDMPAADEFDPDNPPPSVVVLSMGTDATDLVITNGFRVWQRSIPVGGNHFTKALTKELKLTFAKAEHLKRNAATAEDPKAVFQAMRPVFNDLLTEVQRSIGYFTSLDRAAQIQRVLAMGNGIKLPGLRRYLAQSLGFEVVRLEGYNKLVGPEVLAAPAFVENQLCFPVCYGLALQGMKKGFLRTNLLPKEIAKNRLVNSKKPWAVASAAMILLACTATFVSQVRGWSSVKKERFASAEAAAKAVNTKATQYDADAKKAMEAYTATDRVGVNVVESVEGRLRWLELLKTLNACLPTDQPLSEPMQAVLDKKITVNVQGIPLNKAIAALGQAADPNIQFPLDARGLKDAGVSENTPVAVSLPPNVPLKNALDQLLPSLGLGYTAEGTEIRITSLSSVISQRNQLHIRAIDCQRMDSFDGWIGVMKSRDWYAPNEQQLKADLQADPALDAALKAAGATSAVGAGAAGAAPAPGGPKQGVKAPGWLIQITGYHYHNDETKGATGAAFVRNTLIDKLQKGTVLLPSSDPNDAGGEQVSVKDLAISYPVLVDPGTIVAEIVANPLDSAAGAARGATGPLGPAGVGLGKPKIPAKPGDAKAVGRGAGLGLSGEGPKGIPLSRFSFVVQVIWQPLSPAEREQRKKAEAAQIAPTAPGTPPATPPGTPPAAPKPAPGKTAP
jgi:type IV pilus assembly protein PilM